MRRVGAGRGQFLLTEDGSWRRSKSKASAPIEIDSFVLRQRKNGVLVIAAASNSGPKSPSLHPSTNSNVTVIHGRSGQCRGWHRSLRARVPSDFVSRLWG
jgi:hypothetical protein